MIELCDAFEQTMGLVAPEFGLEFKRCSPYHFHLKGVFLLNIYPSKKAVYVQGSNNKTTYNSIDQLIALAKGEGKLSGVEKGKRVASRGRRKKLWDSGVRNCFVCRKEFNSFEETTLEHRVPLAIGGSNRLDNLSLSHEKCNHNRGHSLGVKN